MKLLRAGYRAFCEVEQYLVSALIVAVMFLVFISAVFRSVGMPLNWATDVSLLLFAWLVFLGADVALKHADFMRVDLLVKRLPQAVQDGLYYLFSLVSIGFLLVIVFHGVPLALANSKRLFQTLGISYSWATISAPVGAFLMSTTIGLRVYERWTGRGKAVEFAKEVI